MCMNKAQEKARFQLVIPKDDKDKTMKALGVLGISMSEYICRIIAENSESLELAAKQLNKEHSSMPDSQRRILTKEAMQRRLLEIIHELKTAAIEANTLEPNNA